MSTADATDYTASIIANPGDDFTTDVDLRTLTSDRLTALRDEAATAGDLELVAVIDSLTTPTPRYTWTVTNGVTEETKAGTLQQWADSLNGIDSNGLTMGAIYLMHPDGQAEEIGVHQVEGGTDEYGNQTVYYYAHDGGDAAIRTVIRDY